MSGSKSNMLDRSSTWAILDCGAAIACALVLVVLAAAPAWAGSDERQGSAGAGELKIPVGPRSTALGGTTVADVTGAEAIYWNPAGLASQTGTAAYFSHLSYIADMDVNYFALVTKAGNFGSIGQGLLSHLGTFLGFLAYVVIVPVVTFYLLLDWAKFTRAITDLIPPGRREQVMAFVAEYDHSLGRYIRGQLVEATLVGTLTTISLTLLGVPSALLLGVIAGVFNLIPYIGFTISIFPALVVALTMDDPAGGLLRVITTFAAIQFLDGSITGPRIVGNSVGLHPIWIMIALAMSGAFFGFAGLLIAIPLAVLAKMLLVRGVARYKQSTVYTS